MTKNTNRSYAQVAQSNKKNNTVQLVIKPKIEQDVKVTKNDIKKNIDLISLHIKSDTIVEKRNGSVILKEGLARSLLKN